MQMYANVCIDWRFVIVIYASIDQFEFITFGEIETILDTVRYPVVAIAIDLLDQVDMTIERQSMHQIAYFVFVPFLCFNLDVQRLCYQQKVFQEE